MQVVFFYMAILFYVQKLFLIDKHWCQDIQRKEYTYLYAPNELARFPGLSTSRVWRRTYGRKYCIRKQCFGVTLSGFKPVLLEHRAESLSLDQDRFIFYILIRIRTIIFNNYII